MSLEKLIFRRQYLIGPQSFLPNDYWQSFPIKHNLFLSTHCDLPLVVKEENNKLIAIIGIAIDPFHPQDNEKEILNQLFKQSNNIFSLFEETTPLSGRWVILYQDINNSFLFTDPCGFRQVFYAWDDAERWCASQPELIRQKFDLNFGNDPDMLEFIHRSDFSSRESPWFGNRTIYQECFHLLPNHYLDLKQCNQVRFYPSTPLPKLDSHQIIQEVSEILQGTFEALTRRYELKMALTSGWDSRLLLAGSKKYADRILYFTDKKGIITEKHPDVRVAKNLAEEFGLRYKIMNSEIDPPGWFISLLSNNVTGARILPKTRMIYEKYINSEETVYINGNGGEIFRNYYDKACQQDLEKLGIEKIVQLMGYKDHPKFVLETLQDWAKGLKSNNSFGINLLDLAYWEHRLGNWGAQFPAEQDIAAEEISPFNCRLLINLMLSAPRELRCAPDYYLITQIIHNLWPEIMTFPINPQRKTNLFERIKKKIKRMIMKGTPQRV